MKNIAVLVSGGGTNLQAIIDAQKNGILKSGRVTLVLSSSPDAYALTRAKENGIPTAVVDPHSYGSREAFDEAVLETLERERIGLVILAGFMWILGPRVMERFEHRIINVHPALIPSFCGKGYYGLRVHKAVLAYGVKLTGATVHFVSSDVDGGEVILQKCVEVKDQDTPETLQKRVMEQAEWILLPLAAELVCADRISVNGRRVIIDGDIQI
jgi:phosphoribosylglycinamide formyltransferase-1